MCVRVCVPAPLRRSGRCDRCDRRDRRGCKSHRRSVNLPFNGKATRQWHCSIGPVWKSSGCSFTMCGAQLWRRWTRCAVLHLNDTALPANTPALASPTPSQPARPPAASPPPAECPGACTRSKKHTFRSRVAITKIKPHSRPFSGRNPPDGHR